MGAEPADRVLKSCHGRGSRAIASRALFGLGALAAALLALIVTGCGSSSEQPVARYLAALESEQDRFVEIREKIAETLSEVDPEQPDKAWAEAAERLLFEGAEYGRVATDLEAIAPPEGLEEAHAHLVESLEVSSRMTAEFAANLRGMDSGQLASASGLMSRLGLQVRRDRTRWRSAVIAAAIDAGVDVPAWVEEVGSTA